MLLPPTHAERWKEAFARLALVQRVQGDAPAQLVDDMDSAVDAFAKLFMLSVVAADEQFMHVLW